MSRKDRKLMETNGPADKVRMPMFGSVGVMSGVTNWDPRVLERMDYLARTGQIRNSAAYESGANLALEGETDQEREEREIERQKTALELIGLVTTGQKQKSSSLDDLAETVTTFASGLTIREKMVQNGGLSYIDVTRTNADGSYGGGECRRIGATSFAKQIEASGADTVVAQSVAPKKEEPGFFSQLTDRVSESARSGFNSLASLFDRGTEALPQPKPTPQQIEQYVVRWPAMTTAMNDGMYLNYG